jgi:hypothetical protein
MVERVLLQQIAERAGRFDAIFKAFNAVTDQ